MGHTALLLHGGVYGEIQDRARPVFLAEDGDRVARVTRRRSGSGLAGSRDDRCHGVGMAGPIRGQFTVFAAVVGLPGIPVFGADEAVLRPRVPIDQIELVRTWSNPLPATQETIEKGKQLFHGKAFCMTCHGKDGRGWGGDIEPGPLKGPLPRNFTDKEWQAARTDGALFWINSVPTFVSARLEPS